MTSSTAVQPTWRQKALAELGRLAKTGRPFTVDDLYDAVGHPDQNHKANSRNNQIGNLFHEAQKTGRIEPVGFRPSKQPHRKDGIVRIWRGKGL